MAKFVISGRADCPSYARAERVADRLRASLPNFFVHKISLPPQEWPSWLQEQCLERGWSHAQSPLVWRELVVRGGRGVYVGGVREFEEYAAHYYNVNITADTSATLEEAMSKENLQALEMIHSDSESKLNPQPLHVTVTAASSSLAYQLLLRLATGGVFEDEPISLHLYDSPAHFEELQGTAMEVADLASPTVAGVQCSSSVQEAFRLTRVAFILDYPCAGNINEERREEGSAEGKKDSDGGGHENLVSAHFSPEETQASEVLDRLNTCPESAHAKNTCLDDLASAASLYVKYAAALDFFAHKEAQVIVAGRYGNVGAALLSRFAPSLPSAHIISAASQAEQYARSIIATTLGLNTADVRQVCIWGQTCGDVLVDASSAKVQHFKGVVIGPDPFFLPIERCIFEREWLGCRLQQLVRQRHHASIGVGAISGANALSELMRVWWESRHSQVRKKSPQYWQSVAIISDGECFGFPEGVACSVPARCVDGEWKVVTDMKLSEDMQVQISQQATALLMELNVASDKLK